MKNLIIYILTVLSAVLITSSCGNSSIPDISDINTVLKINRLEKDLFTIQEENIKDQIKMLEKKIWKVF